jgi:hypothetical protein
MSKGVITGKWEGFQDDFIVNYEGTRRLASVKYFNKFDKKGRIKADVWFDRNQNSVIDPREPILATFKANAEVVLYDFKYNSRETGKIVLDKKSGTFNLFHDGKRYASGIVLDRDFFF